MSENKAIAKDSQLKRSFGVAAELQRALVTLLASDRGSTVFSHATPLAAKMCSANTNRSDRHCEWQVGMGTGIPLGSTDGTGESRSNAAFLNHMESGNREIASLQLKLSPASERGGGGGEGIEMRCRIRRGSDLNLLPC